MSLRLRLLAGLVAVTAAGLLTAEIVTYLAVQSFLLDRVDEQLNAAVQPAESRLVREVLTPSNTSASRIVSAPPVTEDAPSSGSRLISSIPPGTFAEARDATGKAVGDIVFSFGGAHPRPDLPAVIDPVRDDGRIFTTSSLDSSERYRVRVESMPTGGAMIVAVPLTEFDRTMEDLRWIGIAVGCSVLLLVAALSWWLVRLGLRPLDRIAVTASGIAAGDLSARIPVSSERTEIGRLAGALNRMLANLESAFAERRASEERLRRFVADASHELRTPLTSIRGYAELFGRGAGQRPEDLARVLRRIDEQSARMSLLVEDLLLLARLDQGRPLEQEPVAIAALVADVLEDARVLQPVREITLSAARGLSVLGDDARLRQVVSNIVTNALRHTPPDAAIQVSVHGEADFAVITVADEGPGLPPDSISHIFEPFYRADQGRTRDQGGAGLGLAIVAAIVRAHGGEVTASIAAAGTGAVFTVRLPALPSQPPATPSDLTRLQRLALPAPSPSLQPDA